MDKRVLRKLMIVGVVLFGVVLFGLHQRRNYDKSDDASSTGGQLGTYTGLVQGPVNRGDHSSTVQNVMEPDKDCSIKQNKLPSESLLQRMSVEDVAEIYHRYVNNLQTLCPVTPIYAGMNAGWQVCASPRTETPATVYFISQSKDDVIAGRFLKEIAADIHASTLEIPKSTILKAMAESTPSAETTPVYDMMKKPMIDILLIHAGNQSADIVQWMDKKKALPSVDQLIVKFESVGKSSSQADYIKQILLLSSLYDQGFRIFLLSRDPDPKCIYKVNGREVTGCYIVYMMRCRNRKPPIIIPPTNELKSMTAINTALLFHSYSLSTQVLCKDVVRVGDINDGGWEVCNDTNYRPSPNCLVYSFGIARDWTFDEEVSKRYGCDVHAFDPSIGLKDHKHSEKVWFYNLGLSNVDGRRGSWQMKTLDSIKQSLGHKNRVLDYVKMDIEESEWGAIAQMVTTGVLKNVRQFAVEVHAPNVGPGPHYVQKLETLNKLYENGFRLFWAHPNQMRGNQRRLAGFAREVTVCYELYYLNTKFTAS